MTQAIVRYSDFRTPPPGAHQVQRIIYRGEGSPVGQRISPNTGAIYVDTISGNIWSCTIANNVTGWEPFYSQITSGITIDTDVQEGDFVGIFGPGVWSNASANINVSRAQTASSGSEFAGWQAGGHDGANNISSTELFNGTSWIMSASSMLTAPATPGTGNLKRMHGGGSQSSAWALGGNGVAAANVYSFMQIFNGDTWSLNSVNSSFSSTSHAASGGTLYSGWHLRGATVTELASSLLGEGFNGNTWIVLPAAFPFIPVTAGGKGTGTSNSHIAFQGSDDAVGGGTTSSTFFYNGTVYEAGPNRNFSNGLSQLSGSSLNAVSCGGLLGIITFPTTGASGTEIYNGCSWIIGNSLSGNRGMGANCGGHNLSYASGGSTDGSTRLNTTEVHTQSIYRRLNFTSAMGAMNIGMAYKTVTASYTASLMHGDIVTHRVPYNNFFGLNKFQHYLSTFYLETQRAVSSIVANMDGTATVTLGTSNTEVTAGMLLEIVGSATTVNNGTFPIISFSGGTIVTIKNPNAANQGASGNAAITWGNRIIGLPTTAISVATGIMTVQFNYTGTISLSTLQRLIPKGSIVYIPYATPSGATGSQFNYGTYVVNLIDVNGMQCTTVHSKNANETIVCNTIELLTHSFARSVYEKEDYALGYNGRMNLITNNGSDSNHERW